MTLFRKMALLLCIGLYQLGSAQQNNGTTRDVPADFTITAQQLQQILQAPAGNELQVKNNPIVNQATVLRNISNGDMQFVRIQLRYYPHAFINVQVNGVYSTFAFLIDEEQKLYYKGELNNDAIVLKKCEKDDIVVE